MQRETALRGSGHDAGHVSAQVRAVIVVQVQDSTERVSNCRQSLVHVLRLQKGAEVLQVIPIGPEGPFIPSRQEGGHKAAALFARSTGAGVIGTSLVSMC